MKASLIGPNALTIGQLRKQACEHKYLLLRSTWGYVIGVNTLVFRMGDNKKHKDSEKTEFYSYKPCDLQEYISHKTVFKSASTA